MVVNFPLIFNELDVKRYCLTTKSDADVAAFDVFGTAFDVFGAAFDVFSAAFDVFSAAFDVFGSAFDVRFYDSKYSLLNS